MAESMMEQGGELNLFEKGKLAAKCWTRLRRRFPFAAI
jgi:hypothetical protein